MSEINALSELKRQKTVDLSRLAEEINLLQMQLEDKEALAKRIKDDLSIIEAAQQMIRESLGDKGDTQEIYPEADEDDTQLETQTNQLDENDSKTEEFPEDWLRPQYRGINLVDAATVVLEAHRGEALSNSDITAYIYDVEEKSDKFIRARNSLAATLRRGAEDGVFQKVGRGYFKANSLDTPPPLQVVDSAQSLVGGGITKAKEPTNNGTRQEVYI